MFVNKSRTRDCKQIWHSKLVFCIDKTKISREQWKRWQLKAKIWVIAEWTNNNFPRNKTSWLDELAVKDQMRRIWFSGSVAQGSVVWWTLCGWWLVKSFLHSCAWARHASKKIWCCVTNPDECSEEDKADIFSIRRISLKNKTITKDIVT